MLGLFDDNGVLYRPQKWELSPQYDTRKSFYGKAYINHYYINGVAIDVLISYDTPVMAAVWEHVDMPVMYRLWEGWSATTQRHVNEFLYQNRWDNYTGKKHWDAMPVYDLSDAVGAIMEVKNA